MTAEFILTNPNNNRSIEFESFEKLIDYINDYDFDDSEFIIELVDAINEPYKIGNLTYFPSAILRKVDPVAWSKVVSDIVESEIENLKYEVERFELEDGDTFNCCGLTIEVVLENEENND